MRIKSKIKSLISLCKQKEVYPVIIPVHDKELLMDKVALITGGSGGIGVAIAQEFLNCGAKVVLAGTSEEKLIKCCDKLGGGDKLSYIVLDLLDVPLFEGKVQEVIDKFGTLDILVNSAGLNNKHAFFDITEDEYDSIMAVNTKGMFFLSRAAGNCMIQLGIKGHILNITSSSALRPAWTPYQISKWAGRGLTLGLADIFLPYGIIVNGLAPGPVATPMLNRQEGDTIYMEDQPSKRYAVAAEIANMAVFLCSEMGNLVVGDTVYMTGGSGILSYHK